MFVSLKLMATLFLKYYSFAGRISLKLPKSTDACYFHISCIYAIQSVLQMINKPNFPIAIADNHPLIRQILIHILISFGYNVIIEAENGKSLIEKLEAGELPDICVIDLKMPFLDGYKATEYIKQKWPSIKVLIFSLDSDIRNRQKAFACGADAFISKLDSTELLKGALKKLKNDL